MLLSEAELPGLIRLHLPCSCMHARLLIRRCVPRLQSPRWMFLCPPCARMEAVYCSYLLAD